MARQAEVPITPGVLSWAIAESGFAPDEVAAALGVSAAVMADWLAGKALPSLTKFRRLAQVLRRSTATFFLPTPPQAAGALVAFRAPPGAKARSLHPKERVRLREVTRLQKTVAWVERTFGGEPVDLPHLRVGSDAEAAGAALRAYVGVSSEAQAAWRSDSDAFHAWREAFENARVSVFALSMGEDAARGFSVWDDEAPLVAVNTHWNVAARIFTLFHELAHLATRTDSICVENDLETEIRDTTDDLERWCERVAGVALMPKADLLGALAQARVTGNADLAVARKIANRFRVSMRAAVLRLVDLERATWSLFHAIPPASDCKRPGGPPGEGRSLAKQRLDEYGRRTPRILISASQHEMLHPVEVMQHLDVTWEGLEELRQAVAG
jgi:Zn-dependent peptidase ImmA (M78 family)/transcriptional regulator with XRE-family HTH domain